AAFLPGPGMAVYYASKAYVLSFSEALHHELKPRGVRVTAVCPGPVPTEFQARAGMSLNGIPQFALVSAEAVAKDAYRGLKEGRRLIIPGMTTKFMPWVVRLAPQSLALRLLAMRQPGAS